jgi:ribosomal protein S18 acetylase RimI-like enzyme
LGLFAGTDLSSRVERVERSLIEAGARAAAQRDPQERVVVLPLGSGLAVWVGAGSPLDKVVGIGMDGDFTDAELDEVERAFADRDTPVQFEVSTLADPAVVDRLTRRGYVLVGFENVLGLRLDRDRRAQVADGVEIHDVGPADFDTWSSVVVDGFATPDTQGVASHEDFPREIIERVQRDLSATPGFAASLARIGGTPAGGASLRCSEGVAQLCGAATLPEFRRRGVQASLLATRLASAAAAGRDLAVVTTGPGSKSQQNVQRLGFQLLYARAILVGSRH